MWRALSQKPVFYPSRSHKALPGQMGISGCLDPHFMARRSYSATWDVTVADTVAASWVVKSSARAAAAAAKVTAQRKEDVIR